MNIWYFTALGFVALLLIGAIALVVYMVRSSKQEDTPTLVDTGKVDESSKKPEEVEPESVFSMPGVRTVEVTTPAGASRVRAALRTDKPGSATTSSPAAPRPATAPVSARNAAPSRPLTRRDLAPDNQEIPAAGAAKKFSWEEDE